MGKDLNGKELGEGISQRKDGVYHARYVNRFGKRVSLYDSSLPKLRKAYKQAVAENICNRTIKKSYTLDEWHDKWQEIYKYGLRPSTIMTYSLLYSHHISPTLGHKNLSDITALDVQALINSLAKAGYGYEMKNSVRIMVGDMFTKAMIDDFALKNPAKAIKLVRDEKEEPRVLDLSEQAEFFDVCRGTFYDEAFTVHVLTGLRPGELFALDPWRDIDFQKREISVTHTLSYQKWEGDLGKTFHLGPPKTESSIRIVPFDERCEIALRRQMRKKAMLSSRTTYSPLPGFESLLFVTKYGTPINSQIYCDAIERIVKLINESRGDLDQFESFSGHCFRHTFATRGFEAGLKPKTIQKLLGHATLQMTMDLYAHLLKEERNNEIEKLSSYTSQVFDTSDELRDQRMAQSDKVVGFP